MPILVLVESLEEKIKKSSREAITYASKIDSDVVVLVLGDVPKLELATLGKNGAKKIILLLCPSSSFQEISTAISEIMTSNKASILVVAKSSRANVIGGRVAIKQNASIASNVVSLPNTSTTFTVKTSIYSGKAFANILLINEKKILVLNKNILDIKEDGTDISEGGEPINIPILDKVTFIGKEEVTGEVLLSDADIVVSGGRGLKGPEHWGMIEDLAKTLGAAMGCSKPVSDMGWRPHHEHVGQTGLKVAPTLYIAIGISGAIQHLAGVNSSKYIVVINTDEDAPFFKAADYGIIGDAFNIIPQLTQAIKAL